MELNPYAKFLGEGDPVEVLRATPAEIARLIKQLGGAHVELRAPARPWTAREIVCHLADCEVVFGFRLRQTLAEDAPVIQPFDQDRWAQRYGNCDMERALGSFEASRRWNLLLIEGATAEERLRPVAHPERGTMTFWTVVETMAGHDINHMRQLRAMAAGS